MDQYIITRKAAYNKALGMNASRVIDGVLQPGGDLAS